MHSWTRSLCKVEKINLGRYDLSPIITLRGVLVDWDFLRACLRLWDPEAHVFRFGAMMEEMCPLFEEFCAIIGCDPNAPLVKHEDPGFGDLCLCPMVREMEDMGCIGGIVLAETIRSLDRATLGFDDWTVSPIILQVWLKDHLQVVAAPTSLPYNPTQYRMRRILITHPSTDAWISWLIELGPNEVLWFIAWYTLLLKLRMSFWLLSFPSIFQLYLFKL
ncbi:hypothetical protein JCGZ_06882 [Jatropha curcas]|uniref:Aminotransferase-like plant mobile domain-containing protein n=1 Tax=Jatropha curcas TaxID=180498 RepID=A0A067KS72_JATCU|nr:hypothetical protein JCGZ_06882 [Jatropha curcas]